MCQVPHYFFVSKGLGLSVEGPDLEFFGPMSGMWTMPRHTDFKISKKFKHYNFYLSCGVRNCNPWYLDKTGEYFVHQRLINL